MGTTIGDGEYDSSLQVGGVSGIILDKAEYTYQGSTVSKPNKQKFTESCIHSENFAPYKGRNRIRGNNCEREDYLEKCGFLPHPREQMSEKDIHSNEGGEYKAGSG